MDCAPSMRQRFGMKALPFGAQDRIGRAIVATQDIATVTEHANSVGILIDHRMVVELITVLRFDADLSSAHAPRLDRRHIAQHQDALSMEWINCCAV